MYQVPESRRQVKTGPGMWNFRSRDPGDEPGRRAGYSVLSRIGFPVNLGGIAGKTLVPDYFRGESFLYNKEGILCWISTISGLTPE